MNRQRFFIPNCGQDAKSLTMTFDIASKLQSESILLVINDDIFKQNLYDLKLIQNNKDNSLIFNKKEINIVTLNKFLKSSVHQNTTVISVWLNSDELFKIEELVGITSVFGIPWTEKSLELWTITYGPIDLTTNERLPFKTISNIQLKDEFDSLGSNRINWSILHSQDIWTIKSLIKKSKNSADPIEIFSYLMREKNLNYKRSTDFMKWTNDLINGKNVRL